jgi:hypothetical protein
MVNLCAPSTPSFNLHVVEGINVKYGVASWDDVSLLFCMWNLHYAHCRGKGTVEGECRGRLVVNMFFFISHLK